MHDGKTHNLSSCSTRAGWELQRSQNCWRVFSELEELGAWMKREKPKRWLWILGLWVQHMPSHATGRENQQHVRLQLKQKVEMFRVSARRKIRRSKKTMTVIKSTEDCGVKIFYVNRSLCLSFHKGLSHPLQSNVELQLKKKTSVHSVHFTKSEHFVQIMPKLKLFSKLWA